MAQTFVAIPGGARPGGSTGSLGGILGLVGNALGGGSTDTSTITSGWTKQQYANASFQPSWLFTRNALTSDTTTAINATISSMNGGGVNAIGTTILIAPASGAAPKTHNLSLSGVGA
jgi:hypothetical protein